MSGTLPTSWGSPTAWQQLQYLYVTDCSLTGEYIIHPLSLVYQKAILMDEFVSCRVHLTKATQGEGPGEVNPCHSDVALHINPFQ